jgi:cyclopropane fatty-acyl-phospholipid synthase-like methyltransferase
MPEPINDPKLNTYRTLLPFKGRLYTSPAGKTLGWGNGVFRGSKANVSDAPIVLESSDPQSSSWRPVSALGFGDPTNVTIFEMAKFNGYLYAGTLNPVTGFQVWKTRAEGNLPYRWSRVVTNGAYRGSLNECALSMCAFDGALYIGTGIEGGGYDKAHKIGPAAAELIRIYPDDSWDLVVGTPRLTPQGYRFPLSGLGPGFDDFYNAYIWRLCVHDGRLYAGTYKWCVFLRYFPLEKWPEWARGLVNRVGIENIIKDDGGFDLWQSGDGIEWNSVTLSGFGNSYNYGARTIVSSPFGLFLGTANPFGPEVGVKVRTGWKYIPNPRGGLEVWLGTKAEESDEALTTHPTSSLERVAGKPSLINKEKIASINQHYDETMYNLLHEEYFDHSDFSNFGCWDDGVITQKEASENLVEKLLDFIPEKRGTILDVACGKGATTRYLLKYYPAKAITGINISEKQLESCRANGPGCRFLLMSATDLEFEDRSFDNIICVEAAFHFDTREKFFQEAFRVLKPKGRLVLSDILMSRWAGEESPLLTKGTYIKGGEEYKSLLLRVGFKSPTVIDATDVCSNRFHAHLLQYIGEKLRLGQISLHTYSSIRAWIFRGTRTIEHYLIASARKARLLS